MHEGKTIKVKVSRFQLVCFIATLIFFVIAAVALAVALGVVLSTKTAGSVDPCDDFYQFSCSIWMSNTEIPADTDVFTALDTLDASNKQKLQNALLGMQGLDTIDALGKVQDLYQSCISTSLTNALGLTPLRELLVRTGGWPLVGIPSNTSWSFNGDQFLQEKLLGSPAFFTLSVVQDFAYPSKYTISVVNSGLTFANFPSFYEEQSVLDFLVDYISSMLQKVNDTVPIETYLKAAEDIVKLEIALAKYYQTLDSDIEAFLDPYINKNPLSYLSTLWSDYDWVNQTQALFSAAGLEDITGNEPIAIMSKNYFGNLTRILSDFSVECLTNYAKWHVVDAALEYLDDDTVASYHAFKRKANPKVIIPEGRNDLCIGIIEQFMPLPLARIYTDYVLEPGAREVVANMTTGVLMSFRERIATRDWLDQATIERAQNKVDHITQTIAYPDEIENDDWLNALYANYDIDDTNLFLNYYQFLQNTITGNLRQLRDDYSVWETIPVPSIAAPTKVNAFYSPLRNSINILEGIMGSPAFNKDWPLYSVYGALGAIIGHEITHGFDNQGRLFNETGHFEDWWTPSSAENFITRSQCFVDQYGSFQMFGNSVNGNRTLGENIADNGGLGAAYDAYKEAVNESGSEPLTFPGLDFTPDQLFFIAFARLWCSYYTLAGFTNTVDFGVHSPGLFRVYGSLQNSKEFADAFQCPNNSYMNPTNKCSLW